MCHAQELGSYAQGQGHNHVRGQIVPEIVFLINYSNKFDKTSQKDEAYRISSDIRRTFFSFQNNPKDLDPSYKTDLDL